MSRERAASSSRGEASDGSMSCKYPRVSVTELRSLGAKMQAAVPLVGRRAGCQEIAGPVFQLQPGVCHMLAVSQAGTAGFSEEVGTTS